MNILISKIIQCVKVVRIFYIRIVNKNGLNKQFVCKNVYIVDKNIDIQKIEKNIKYT
jgi:hypothetical protein